MDVRRDARCVSCADVANGWPPGTMTARDLLADDSIPAGVAGPARFVAAVITTYNCYTSIERTILAIANQVGKVIIVDNGSEPETLDAIRGVIERNRLKTCKFPLDHIDYEYYYVRITGARWPLLICPSARDINRAERRSYGLPKFQAAGGHRPHLGGPGAGSWTRKQPFPGRAIRTGHVHRPARRRRPRRELRAELLIGTC